MRPILFPLLLTLVASMACSAQSSSNSRVPRPAAGTADLIFFDGVIYTGEGFTEDKPQVVQAIAITGGKVLAVGRNEEILHLSGPQTVLHDLGEKTYIFPGFNDAHTHLGSAGETKLNVDLTGAKSLEEMLAKIQTAARNSPDGHWLIGGNWDHTLWPGKKLPTRQDLDKVTGRHPAFLDRIDGHIALANSAALVAAGVTGKTHPPQGGAIDLDRDGEPTGILRESAQSLISKIIPPATPEERRKGDELAIEDALHHGVTSVQDFSDWQDFLVFETMEKEGNLHLRISEWIPFKDSLEELETKRAHHDIHDPMIHTGMLKGFMDGSLGSRTAAMKAPFADDPGNTGLPQYTQEQLNRMTVERAQAGFQIGFHAIGDAASAMALDAFTAAQIAVNATCRPAGRPPRQAGEKTSCATLSPRNRIEHAQVVDPVDIPRFRQLGVIASMQPNHLLTDMNWAVDRLGPERAAYSYAWKTLLDAGVRLAFGTDYPVEPITPFRGLYAAVTRMNEAGTQSYYPENRLSRGQALAAYTQGSAYAEFAENHKGKLLPGYEADFILVDRDLYRVDAPALLDTRVLNTYVAGQDALASLAGN